jgi:hypothetical protein
MQECKDSIIQTKKEIQKFKTTDIEIKKFLEQLHDTWIEKI